MFSQFFSGAIPVLKRSPESIQLLPLPNRWEVTRRHPYYLLFWRLAAEGVAGNARAQENARLMLQQIAFSGEPVAPDSGSEMFGNEQLPNYWVDGAIAPVRIRTLVATMFACLPPETLRAVASLLLRAANLNPNDPDERYRLVQSITQESHPHFDDLFPQLMIIINPRAPQRAIVHAVEDLVRSVRDQLGINESRRRDDRFTDYVSVWDLREGWVNGHYESRRERRLVDIAAELRRPIQTVANQYRAAFRLIFGEDYSPERWFDGIGLFKCLGWIGGGMGQITSRRPRRIRRPREVPESTLHANRPMSDENESSIFESAGIVPTDILDVDLRIDVNELILNGWINSRIIDELELPPGSETEELLNYLRSRVEAM